MKEETVEEKTPTQLFFDATKKRPWVRDTYIAIQSAMALGIKEVIDFNDLADEIMPRADRIPGFGFSLEKEGLDALGLLFDCECIEKGSTNYHEYKFTRKSDGKSVVGTVKV